MGIEARGWDSVLPPVFSPAAIKPTGGKERKKKWIKTVSWGVADMAFRPKHLKKKKKSLTGNIPGRTEC